MPIRHWLYALLPLFAGCVYNPANDAGEKPPVRLQGELSMADGRMLLRPCQEQRRFVLTDAASLGLQEDVRELLGGGTAPLFADIAGSYAASRVSGTDGEFNVLQRYRLQDGAQRCDEPNFARLLLHAGGRQPEWSVDVGESGLMLERSGRPAQAFPYLEEQLPEGRLNLTSEANGQRLELWIAPQRCVDPTTGTVQSLAAELRVDGQVQRGCAYFGGARTP
jgi:putative lipoprotein